jgi:hypothetical protein
MAAQLLGFARLRPVLMVAQLSGFARLRSDKKQRRKIKNGGDWLAPILAVSL